MEYPGTRAAVPGAQGPALEPLQAEPGSTTE